MGRAPRETPPFGPQVGNTERLFAGGIACLPGALRIEPPFEAGHPSLESAKDFEHLIEATVEVVVLTAVFDLQGVKTGR